MPDSVAADWLRAGRQRANADQRRVERRFGRAVRTPRQRVIAQVRPSVDICSLFLYFFELFLNVLCSNLNERVAQLRSNVDELQSLVGVKSDALKRLTLRVRVAREQASDSELSGALQSSFYNSTYFKNIKVSVVVFEKFTCSKFSIFSGFHDTDR